MKNVEDLYKLTPGQHDLLADRDPGAQLDALGVAIPRGCDEAQLAAAAVEVAQRHPVLRTAILVAGLKEPLQVVRQTVTVPWQRRAIGAASGSVEPGADAVLAQLAAEPQRPFALASAPLVRFTLLASAAGPWRGLVMAFHLGVLDRGSARQVLAEVLAVAEARGAGRLPELPSRRAPRDYIAWLEQHAAGGPRDSALGLLREAVSRSAAAPSSSGAASVQQLAISSPTGTELTGLARHVGVSTTAVLQGAWALAAAACARTAADADPVEVAFALLVDARPESLPESGAMLGGLTRPVPRRTGVVPAAPLAAWLRALHAETQAVAELAQYSAAALRAHAGAAAGAPASALAVDVRAARDALEEVGQRIGALEVGASVAPLGAPLVAAVVVGAQLTLTVRHDPTQVTAAAAAEHLEALAAAIAALVAAGTAADAVVGTPLAAARSAVARGRAAAAAALAAPATQVEGGRPGLADAAALLARHPLVRAAAVTIDRGEAAIAVEPIPGALPARGQPLAFSLFYFADANAAGADKYKIYLEGAKLADQHRFTAVWTPERHFHENGGLYPNPSVLSAALAAVTSHVQLRAGSVVLPLHHPLRIVEEWAVVDNLSGGRVGIAAASGWVPNDFVFRPGTYDRRREVMFEQLSTIRRLWRGEALDTIDGRNEPTQLRAYPRPLQPDLPIWLTAAANPDTYTQAGALDCHVLTGLLYQSLDEVAERVRLYRAARERAGLDPARGVVTLMLHTFLGARADEALATVRAPFLRYLRSHVSLMEGFVKTMGLPIDLSDPKWLDSISELAFERYRRSAALLGTPASVQPLIDQLHAADIDEVACLVDFGVPADAVLASLPQIARLKAMGESAAAHVEGVLAAWLAERCPLAEPVAIRVRAVP
jgi:natural product biosynthesis luciferase-like monooxygenase protein